MPHSRLLSPLSESVNLTHISRNSQRKCHFSQTFSNSPMQMNQAPPNHHHHPSSTGIFIIALMLICLMIVLNWHVSNSFPPFLPPFVLSSLCSSFSPQPVLWPAQQAPLKVGLRTDTGAVPNQEQDTGQLGPLGLGDWQIKPNNADHSRKHRKELAFGIELYKSL